MNFRDFRAFLGVGEDGLNAASWAGKDKRSLQVLLTDEKTETETAAHLAQPMGRAGGLQTKATAKHSSAPQECRPGVCVSRWGKTTHFSGGRGAVAQVTEWGPAESQEDNEPFPSFSDVLRGDRLSFNP